MTKNRLSDKLLIAGLITCFLGLSSCSSTYKTLVIETARPALHMLPYDINSLTLMDRSITDQFRNFNEDSLQQYFFNKGFIYSGVVLDSTAADTTLKVLGELLFESGRYDVVIPEERFLERNKEFNKLEENLSRDEVASICEQFNTDALLVIERYINNLMTTYTVYNEHPGDLPYATASIDSKYSVAVKIYSPKQGNLIRQFAVEDTIYWGNGAYSTQALFAKLPSVKGCLIQTGIQAALDIDALISPSWVKDSRIYFTLEKDDAIRISNFAAEQKWQEAYDYWLKYANTQQTSTKAKAEFNLALASEMLGNIDAAIDWATKSYYTKYMQQTKNYLLKLKKRQEALQKFIE